MARAMGVRPNHRFLGDIGASPESAASRASPTHLRRRGGVRGARVRLGFPGLALDRGARGLSPEPGGVGGRTATAAPTDPLGGRREREGGDVELLAALILR